MNVRTIGGLALCFTLAGGRETFAQASPPSVFVDAAVMTDRDPTEFFWQVAVRTVSYSLLYARHYAVASRVQISLIAGGGIEERAYRSSDTFDELGADGVVVRHTAFAGTHTKNWFAAVLGADAEVALTWHLAIAPQIRFHTFPNVSILRPGIALRWRF